MYTLIIEDRHGRAAEEISFSQGSYTIGRVEGSDIILPSSSVSRTHARISVSNGRCYIDDLGSANGVVVNGVPVKTRQELQNGAKLRIGEYTLYLEYKEKVSVEQDILRTQIVANNQNGYKIVRVGDKFAGEEFSLSESVNTIGRTEENYILLSDPSISRNHATIQNLGMSSRLSDLGSSNGTFVNGKRVKTEIILQSGDEIRFGNIRFVFVPISVRVDIQAYAVSHFGGNRNLYLLILGIIIIVVAASTLLIIHFTNSSKQEANKPVAELMQDPAILYNKKMEEARKYFEQNNFLKAKEIADEVLLTMPNDLRATDLVEDSEREMEHEALFKKADELFIKQSYELAIDTLKQVREDSKFAERAKQQIEMIEAKLLQSEFLRAKSSCDIKPDPKCMEEMCQFAVKLRDSSDRELRIKETSAFVDSFSKRNTFLPAVRACRKIFSENK